MKKLLGFLILALSLNAFSTEFNLNSAKNQVVNDNINIAIAYQNYVSVKSESKAKALQLLPSISIDLLVSDYEYTILRSVIPEPSKFFTAKAGKDLAEAADINRTIVKKNLLEDLEKTYFLYQFHQESLASLKQELAIRTTIAERSQEAYDLGSISFTQYYSVQRDLVATRSNVVNANEIVKNDEFALKLILQENNLSDFSLVTESLYNGSLDYPADVEAAMDVAVNNSKEIEQYDFLIAAAKNTKNGEALSWLSWNGVGFDYFARVSIAKSEVAKVELQQKKARIELKNQVAAMYTEIANQKEKIALQDQLVQMAQDNYAKTAQNNNDQLATVVTLKQAELSLMNAQRDSRRMQYELELKFIKLKRILGTNMMTNVVPKA
jgi:outer membrane protein TolC